MAALPCKFADALESLEGGMHDVGAVGAVVAYSSLGSGDFATQVGYVSDVAADKIIIQCKTFGELA